MIKERPTTAMMRLVDYTACWLRAGGVESAAQTSSVWWWSFAVAVSAERNKQASGRTFSGGKQNQA
jgi:hypothetical protein